MESDLQTRILAGIAVGLMICALLAPSAPPLEWSAQAQVQPPIRQAQVKKKGPQPKELPKSPPERTPFTVDDALAAVIPGIPDARAWGDQAVDFCLLYTSPSPRDS